MKWIVIFIAILVVSVCAGAQTSADCPVNLVCITPAAARQALQDSDTVKAQAAELAVKDQAIADLKNLAESLKTDVAKLTGEKTQLESAAVRYTAIIDALLRSFKKSHKFGIVNIN